MCHIQRGLRASQKVLDPVGRSFEQARMRFEVQPKGDQGQLEESLGQQKGSEGKPEGSEGEPEGSECHGTS